MEVQYRRERQESYLIIEEEEPGDAYAIRMLTENRIPGVLALSVKQMDQHMVYSYEISGRQSLQKLLEKRSISAEEIRLLFYGIERSLTALENHLLDVNDVLLEPEFLYVRADFSEIDLCCHPSGGGDLFQRLRLLSQYLLNKIDHTDTSSVELAYELFRIASEEDFHFQEIRKALEKSEAAEQPPVTDVSMECPDFDQEEIQVRPESTGGSWETEEELLPEQLREPERKMFWSLLLPVGGFLLVGAFYVLGGLNRFSALTQGGILLLAAAVLVFLGLRIRQWEMGGRRKGEKRVDFDGYGGQKTGNDGAFSGKTEVLTKQRQTLEKPCQLISQNLFRSETLTLYQLPALVGKLPQSCDLVIGQPAVSRIHARLEQKEKGIYLTDLHSTNGTFQNGRRLVPEHPYLLQSGDEVAFADVKYIFQ